MSSDENFAAQMWPWPDPMLKRNAQGGILFVNAAFLQVYGGQVTDWHGNCVTGWSAPMGGSVPNRFETRLSTAQGEVVFDWIEYTLADGGTLAIARDVTDIVTAPEPDPAYSATPAMTAPPVSGDMHMPVENQLASASPQDYAPAQAELPEPVQPQTQPQPQLEAFAADPVVDTAQFDIPSFEPTPVEIPTVEIPQFDTPVYEAQPQETAPAAIEPEHAAPVQIEPSVVSEVATPAPVSTPLQPADRDYERRALPIENEESVLGTNWRDAVIAKAVGHALPSDDTAPESEEDTEASLNPALLKTDGPLRILLAEDNAINALLTRTLLEAEGCHVDVVEDGALAVEAMKSQSYDMIFMDMRMPNMDGLESTRKIRALPNVPKNLPIVALTANAFDDDRNACFDSGMNDFMTKPVSAEELADMVNQWARRQEDVAA